MVGFAAITIRIKAFIKLPPVVGRLRNVSTNRVETFILLGMQYDPSTYYAFIYATSYAA